jgi:hypothetical protein
VKEERERETRERDGNTLRAQRRMLNSFGIRRREVFLERME